VNTKADIRFDVLGADFLPDWVKENLMQQARTPPARCALLVLAHVPSHARRRQEKNRMNNEGELVVNSSRHRTQKCGGCQHSPACTPGAAASHLAARRVRHAGRTMRTRWRSCR
jgi:hypothetical protein